MKKISTALIISALALPKAQAQQPTPEPYQFKEVRELTCTPVKNQGRTGTCWCFSTTSFLESELIRREKGQLNLSEAFTVRNIYRKKMDNYVRRQGTANLDEGGLAHDMVNAANEFGVVPEDVYPGQKDPSKPLNHAEFVKNFKELGKTLVAQSEKGELSANWGVRVDSMLDSEFGVLPKTFKVEGKEYTPLTYAESLGINASDYVTVTSFTHHPFWQPFILETRDNWANGSLYNLPLEDLMRSLNYALQQGYTVEWDADVSNAGFSQKNGVAIVPTLDWSAKNEAQRAGTWKYTESEKIVTQEMRQKAFDMAETYDDHLMHIVGLEDEAHGGIFYKVKNSWGEVGTLKGFINCSEAYMRLNTISFTVNKNALPQDIRRRLGLEPGEVNMDRRGAPLKINGTNGNPNNATNPPAEGRDRNGAPVQYRTNKFPDIKREQKRE